ncbi:hypothetical protein WN51_11105 [Melipona quadrifasciata]|uniref:Uncharacterized protein n=1 Tax=Melipona quadrifasciata TaxID=166423 RepID=A0A0N0BHX8_9HYME|nr:hypothetical protein WN51_11105 [Melipona quadrifasciata]
MEGTEISGEKALEEDEAGRFVEKGKPPKADEKIRRKREAEAAQKEDNIYSGESFWLLAAILEKTDSPDTKEGRRKRKRDGNNTISTNEVTGEKGRDDKGKSWESGLILLNNFLSSDIIPTSSKEKESDELSYTRFGHSLWSANQLPAQGVESHKLKGTPTNFEHSLENAHCPSEALGEC